MNEHIEKPPPDEVTAHELDFLRKAKNRFSLIYDYLTAFREEVRSQIQHVQGRMNGCEEYSLCGTAEPIILVHGHTGHKTNFNILRDYLEKAHIGPIHVIQFEDPWISIEAHAKELQKKIKEVIVLHRTNKIRLLGASRGGIVVAYYTEYLAQKDLVDITTVITLAAPLDGTKIANLLLSTRLAPEDLGYKSPKVCALKKRILANKTTTYFTIGTRTDYVVVPHNSAFLGIDKTRELHVSGYSHNSILYCPKIAKQIVEWLTIKIDSSRDLSA